MSRIVHLMVSSAAPDRKYSLFFSSAYTSRLHKNEQPAAEGARRSGPRRRGFVARKGGALLFTRRYGSLRGSPQVFRPLRRKLPVRPSRPGVPGPSDVVLGRQPRVREPGGHRGDARADGEVAAIGMPIPPSRKNRTCRDDLPV